MEKCKSCDAVPPAVPDAPLSKEALAETAVQSLPRSKEPDNATVPIRTVMYVEVGNLPPNEVRDIVASLTATLNPGHPHFVVPLRNGKMNTDLNFENEVLEFVQSICEVQDGQIVLKGGCHDVDVIRVRF